MSRGGTPSLPTTSSASASVSPPNSQFEQSAKNVLAQVVKISKLVHRTRAPSLIKNQDVQNLLDTELFQIQPDRRSKLTQLQQYRLVHVLAQFFLERVEDGNRYSYFEAVFLGREGDPILHDFRIEIMMQLASFSLQFPVLQMFNHITNWLSKITDEEQAFYYSDMLVEIIVDHYLGPESKEQMFQYLLPLEFSCGEFTAIFTALAPQHGDINIEMCLLLAEYTHKNMQFILRHLRDTPYLKKSFASKSMPALVRFLLETNEEMEMIEHLTTAVCYIISRWEVKVLSATKSKEELKMSKIDVLDLTLSEDFGWTKRRCALISTAASVSATAMRHATSKLESMSIPPTFKPLLSEFFGGEDNGIKEHREEKKKSPKKEEEMEIMEEIVE